MGKISMDISSIKAAGVYTLEIDNSQRTSENTDSLRLLVGFSNKGVFNRPVLLEKDADNLGVFGDIDTKLEHKGCYFNRMLKTLLTNGPVIALNLLKVNHEFNGPDQINYAALSLDAATANPKIKQVATKYGEYDYLADSLDNTIYDTAKGDIIPFIGTTPYSSVYNRARFWTPDKELLTAAASRGLQTSDYTIGSASFEYSNLLNFANVGTEEFSILVFKPGSMPGYDVTAESWFGGKENIPYGWIRPYDYISDYFLQVICVKGNWTNYAVLSTDPVWGGYFDKKGVIKEKINTFLGAEGITVMGSWTGIIIPDFTDKQGNNLSLEKKINAQTERTGLLASFNEDAANVLTFDYTGADYDETMADQGAWGIDIDNNSEIESEYGENVAPYIVDMCGHGAFMEKEIPTEVYEDIDLTAIVDKDQLVGERLSKAAFDMTCISKYEDAVDTSVFTGTVKKPVYSNDISAGLYIPTEILKVNADTPIDAVLDSSLFNENNIAALVNTKYSEIMKNGIAPKNAPLPLVELPEVIENDTVDASVYVKYGAETVLINLTIYTDVNEDNKMFITDVEYTSVKQKMDMSNAEAVYGINFLSYNYVHEENDGVIETVNSVKYFNDPTLWENEIPVNEDVKNMFIITNSDEWLDEKIKVGDYVQNITYNNEIGKAAEYRLIPGLARVIKKQFIQVLDGNVVSYKNKDKNVQYVYNGETMQAKNGNIGFYLITTTAPVLIENDSIVRQLPIYDDKISHSLRFIPMKGLQLSSRHRPGYDADGNLDIEGGIEKIYAVLEEEGIWRGLMNPEMVNYRYIIDSMSYGLRSELGGKVHLSRVAQERGKCTALLNLPSAKQFAVSSNPYFCDSYIPATESRPGLNTKYIPLGGNTEMGSTAVFSLPTEDDGAKFTACFWPHVIYNVNGKTVTVPPAADVANVLNRKFTGVNDPYCICANTNGILSNKYLVGLEFLADVSDREYLEPFGVNTIIKEQGNIMIYGNQTAFQDIKSDLNKLHIRENLNTAEIECEAVLKHFNFLYNTPTVRANIVQQLTPILQTMQLSGAIAQYEIICDESNNTPDVIEADACKVDINLWFNHGMEKILQTFTINRYAINKN